MIGEARRQFHRKAFSRTVREERLRAGKTQGDLAEDLGVDDRQVVRLEKGEVPPTLEVIEAVAEALGVPTLVFFHSTLQPADPTNVEAVSRWAQREIKARFQAARDREEVADLVREVAALPNEDLAHVRAVARAFRQARPLEGPVTALGMLAYAVYTPISRGGTARKNRTEARPRAKKRTGALRTKRGRL
jgi:transcriptional regulator with XRE-family HTH domain